MPDISSSTDTGLAPRKLVIDLIEKFLTSIYQSINHYSESLRSSSVSKRIEQPAPTQITINSAFKAPARFIASSMAIRSPGAAPT